MEKLTRDDLLSLEAYAEQRPAFRADVIAHKKNRRVAIGSHAVLYFEDRLTVQYQIQEMLRIERIFEAPAINEELQAYNPLIPDGRNLKATFMIEYADADVRREALARLRGIEDRVWLRVGDGEPVYGIADEDLERSNDEKTSAVHFVRFELGEVASSALKSGESLGFGIDHDAYPHRIDCLAPNIRDALAADLDD